MSAESSYFRSPGLLSRAATRLLIIDVQEKLVPVIDEHTTLVNNCCDLVRAADLLHVPVFATEQYPQGLGATVAELNEHLPVVAQKRRFSAAEVLDWEVQRPDGTSQNQVVVAGIEAHVCVLQTVLDLLSLGFDVHVPADAVGSRHSIDRDRALQRMRDTGATITTTETVIFEVCETADAPEFKLISKLIQERSQHC